MGWRLNISIHVTETVCKGKGIKVFLFEESRGLPGPILASQKKIPAPLCKIWWRVSLYRQLQKKQRWLSECMQVGNWEPRQPHHHALFSNNIPAAGSNNSMRGWPIRGSVVSVATHTSFHRSQVFKDRTGDMERNEYRYDIARIIPNTLTPGVHCLPMLATSEYPQFE